jgi:enamine deaminase RidA (YjgF/YER057c/UK114 family)
MSMEQRKINPWAWQNQFAFSQAIEVSGATRVLYCAGQTSVDAEGRPIHVGDMRGQIELAFQNLETVLKAAGFALGDVARLNYYTTDVDSFLAAYEVAASHLAKAGCQPSSTLLAVTRLAFPELLVEVEATAVK